MSPHRDDDTVNEKLEDIDGKLKDIEKAFKSSSEEQLFFGIAFSLLVLFITLPMNDAVNFLQNLFSLSYDLATKSAIGIRAVGIVFALAASLLRYYGSMCREHTSKRMRLFSILSLLMGFEFFIFIIGQNTFWGIAIRTTWVIIPLGTLLMTIVFGFIFLLEKRMLDFYVSKRLIIRSEAIPIVSPFFVFLNAANLFGMFFGILSLFLARPYADAIDEVSFLAIFFGLLAIYIKRAIGKHARKSGKQLEGKPFQSKISRWF